MALTVRLNSKTERALNALVKRRRLSRSDIVREAIARYASSDEAGSTASQPYDGWVDVIGIVDLGARDEHRSTGEQFAAIVKRQFRKRRRAR